MLKNEMIMYKEGYDLAIKIINSMLYNKYDLMVVCNDNGYIVGIDRLSKSNNETINKLLEHIRYEHKKNKTKHMSNKMYKEG